MNTISGDYQEKQWVKEISIQDTQLNLLPHHYALFFRA